MRILLLIFISVFSFSANATALTATEKAIAEQKFAVIEEGIKHGDVTKIFDVMPPKLLDKMSAAYKEQTGRDDFKALLIQLSNRAMEDVELLSYRYDLDKVDMQTSSSGRKYAFIDTSTQFKVKANGSETTVDGYLLLLEDENEWYIIRWEDQYKALLQEVYPDLTDNFMTP